jgi:gluconate 2-dehydrogenase gamma chain
VNRLENNDEQKQSPSPGVKQPSRRKFLVHAGYALGGAVVGGALGSLIRRPAKQPETATPSPGATAVPRNYNRALMFFTPEQYQITDALTERFFPAEESGPGARDLGVAFFIDHQLAGDWGFNSREYMSPPFFVGEKVQGYQGRLKRREIFEIGLREIDNHSMSKFNKMFVDLTGEQQDDVLKAFESDEVDVTTISPSGFFKMLRSSTLEGAYSDPLYGGNADMNGWRMRSFPGSQMSYLSIIDKDFTPIEPEGLQSHMTAH